MLNMGTRQSREQADTVHDYTAHVADANKVMSLVDKVVLVTLTGANNSAITLPSVSEAAGEIFVIRLVAVGSGAVTISDKANDAGLSDITLNAAGQYTVLCSDGQAWLNQLFTSTSASTTATGAELNNAADVSARVQTLTATGAVTAGVQSVQLNHASVVIAATIANANAHQGLFIVKDTSASGTAAHTLTLTAGTWDGTNTVATLNAPKEALVVYFDSAGNGTILENVGSVGLS